MENDVHFLGVSSLAAGHKTLVPQVIEELIFDGVARATHARAFRVAALNHEAINHAMKNHAIVEALFRQIDKVLRRNRGLILEKFDFKRTFVGFKNCNAISHFFASIIFRLIWHFFLFFYILIFIFIFFF